MPSGPSSCSPWDPLKDIAQFEQDGVLHTLQRETQARQARFVGSPGPRRQVSTPKGPARSILSSGRGRSDAGVAAICNHAVLFLPVPCLVTLTPTPAGPPVAQHGNPARQALQDPQFSVSPSVQGTVPGNWPRPAAPRAAPVGGHSTRACSTGEEAESEQPGTCPGSRRGQACAQRHRCQAQGAAGGRAPDTAAAQVGRVRSVAGASSVGPRRCWAPRVPSSACSRRRLAGPSPLPCPVTCEDSEARSQELLTLRTVHQRLPPSPASS